MLKGSIQEDSITFVNIHGPNVGAPKYIKQILIDIKGKIDNNTIIVGNFNTPFTSVDISASQKINENSGTKWHIRPTGFNRYLQDIPSQNNRIHILFKCTWNVLQDRSHARPQNMPHQI